MLGGVAGVGAGKLSGLAGSRVLTQAISNPNFDPSLGVLLTGPSMIQVPNQGAAAVMNMLGGTAGQAGVAAVAPPVSNNTLP